MLVSLLLVGVLAAVAGQQLFLHQLGDDPASRAHPAIVWNVVDLAGRGCVVLALGALLSLRIPDRPRRALVRLGRGSLVAYVVHIPFCYGRLEGPLVGDSTMLEATLALVVLIAISWSAVYAWDAFKAEIRLRNASMASRAAGSPRNATRSEAAPARRDPTRGSG